MCGCCLAVGQLSGDCFNSGDRLFYSYWEKLYNGAGETKCSTWQEKGGGSRAMMTQGPKCMERFWQSGSNIYHECQHYDR